MTTDQDDILLRLHTAKSYLLVIKDSLDKQHELVLATKVACAIEDVKEAIGRAEAKWD